MVPKKIFFLILFQVKFKARCNIIRNFQKQQPIALQCFCTFYSIIEWSGFGNKSLLAKFLCQRHPIYHLQFEPASLAPKVTFQSFFATEILLLGIPVTWEVKCLIWEWLKTINPKNNFRKINQFPITCYLVSCHMLLKPAMYV